jgi:hypothetical protein
LRPLAEQLSRETQHAPIRSIHDQLGRQPRGSVRDHGPQDHDATCLATPDHEHPRALAFRYTALVFTAFTTRKKTGKRRWTKKPTSRARTTGKEMKIAKGISAGRVCCCRLRSQRCRLAIQPTAQPAAEAPALQGFAARPSLLPSLSLQLLEPRRGHEREKRTARCRWTNNTKRYSNVAY